MTSNEYRLEKTVQNRLARQSTDAISWFQNKRLPTSRRLFGLIILLGILASGCQVVEGSAFIEATLTATPNVTRSQTVVPAWSTEITEETDSLAKLSNTPVPTLPIEKITNPTQISNPTSNQIQIHQDLNRLPTTSSDLLYISNDRLVRWDHLTHFGVTLAENVRSYSTDSSGKIILMLRPQNMTANGGELFYLDYLDLQTKRIQKLAEDISSIDRLAISPDGRWAAYSQSDTTGGIRVFRLTEPQNVAVIGNCVHSESDHCQDLVWSPDSRNLLWIDSHGIWIGDPNNGVSENVNSGTVDVKDPGGKIIELNASFSSPRWAPTGRFVLIKVQPADSKVSWEAVLDTRTQKIFQVIDSYETAATDASLAWLQDGTLITAQSSHPFQAIPATLQHWKLIPTNPEVLLSIERIQLSPEKLLADLAGENFNISSNMTLCLDWLQPMASGHVLVGARLPGLAFDPILFELDLSKGTFTAISQVADTIEGVIWAPDGSGFLLVGQAGKVIYRETAAMEIFEDYSFLDDQPHSFSWLPPEPRN